MEADADAELRFYEARAAALCASPERAAVGAQPPMDPPPPPPPEQKRAATGQGWSKMHV